jgi:peptide/nickel transport system substrate-binding protein
LGRYLRWQAVIALLGIALLAALLRYASYSFTAVTVPDRGGAYVEGVAGNPQYLNPLLSQYNQVDETLVSLLFNGLTKLDERGNVVPDLAEGWLVSEDGLTYDFRLRPGLVWHDGRPVTAADVLYTVGAMQSEEFPGVPWLSTLWRAVKVEAPEGPDGLWVRFTLSQVLPSFLDYTTIGLLPAHIWKDVPIAQMRESQYSTRPVGTGPFKVDRITATRADLAVNPRYPGKTPYLTGISFRFYPDHESLLSAYDREEIDGVSWLWPTDMKAAADRADMNVFTSPLSGYTLIYLNQDNPNTPFFQEKEVRQALLYGLDRQGLIDREMNGQAVVAHSPILPGTWAHAPEITEYAYDPATARTLLEQAGWIDSDGDGVRDREGANLSFILLGDNQALLDEISRMWAEIGVQATPQSVTLPGLTADFLTPRTFDAAVVHWELSGDPDPYPLWHSTQITEGQNYAGWNNRAADEAIERARTTNDPAQRREEYILWQQLFADEAPALLLYHPVYTFGVRDKVNDVSVGPMNRPADRFNSIADWYTVTRRVTMGSHEEGVPTAAMPTEEP